MDGIWHVVFGVCLIAWGVARVAGWLPRWVPPRSYPGWFGSVEVILGAGLVVFSLGGQWIVDSPWVLPLVLIVVFIGEVTLAFRGLGRSKKLRESEEERLRAFLREHEERYR